MSHLSLAPDEHGLHLLHNTNYDYYKPDLYYLEYEAILIILSNFPHRNRNNWVYISELASEYANRSITTLLGNSFLVYNWAG
jgi:hypothetical protein